MDPKLGDEVAENTLDAIAKFNIDMKVLALNAYQLQDLLELSIQENELMINWLAYLENKTIRNEEKLYKIIDKAEKTVKKKAKAAGVNFVSTSASQPRMPSPVGGRSGASAVAARALPGLSWPPL